jgi:hypothetical protein
MTDAKDRLQGEGGFIDRAVERVLPDIVSKAVASAIRSVLTTHEGLKRAADGIPSEVAKFLSTQWDSARTDAFRILTQEFREFLDRLNVGQELVRALTALTLQVTMEVRFVPNDKGGVRPSVKATLRPK